VVLIRSQGQLLGWVQATTREAALADNWAFLAERRGQDERRLRLKLTKAAPGL
jgi:hypothetical protein